MAYVLVIELAWSSEVPPNVLVTQSVLIYRCTRFYECDGFEPDLEIFESVITDLSKFSIFFLQKDSENSFLFSYYWQVH